MESARLSEWLPDVMSRMRGDLSDWRRWAAWTIVLGHAAVAGLGIVAFTWLSERALKAFSTGVASVWWLPFLWTPACCAAIVFLTRRWFPHAAGSGIPQVMVALAPSIGRRRRALLVSLRMSLAKIGLTTMGLLGGLAVGREGPSVQIAAGVMLNAGRWMRPGTGPSAHGLLVAGGAAGIAAAFNAPLAGVMFAIEELSRDLDERNSGLVVSAIVLAGLVAVSAMGNNAYFGVIRVPPLDAGVILPALLVAVAAGLLGGLFSRLLLSSLAAAPADPFSRWRARRPITFAAAAGLVIACAGWASGGATSGSGYEYTRGLLAGHADVPLLYVTLRFLVTWLCAWASVPGGLFAPCLAIGAGIGHDIAALTGYHAAPAALIAIGMAGFLAAVTQAPLTAFIIVMEMVDGHSMVLTLMSAAIASSLVGGWLSPPLYPTLAAATRRRLGLRPEGAGGP